MARSLLMCPLLARARFARVTGRRVRSALLLLVLLCVCGCADVRFEKSPYAIRGLDIVYSRQEDVTFLSWRLRQGADPDRVSFELYQEGAYRTIDLDQALFAADPYPCDTHYLCFQFQLPGRYDWPDEVRPLRSIHVDEGIYAGGIPAVQEVAITFGIAPIALGRNTSIDPRRYDWFELNDIPLQRDYQWQLTPSTRAGYLVADPSKGECQDPTPSAWQGLGEEVDPPSPDWVETPVCMAARPVRRDEQGLVRNVPFPPSALLSAEQQDYIPREERPPAIYAYLIDTLIKSESRCERTLGAIRERIDLNFGNRLPESIPLGTFTPLDPQYGRPLSGCAQRADQDYPVRQLLDALKQAAAQLEPQQVRFVLVYINNVDLPPSDRVLAQLQELYISFALIENVVPYGMAIGSNLIMELFPWDASVGWRPIDDESFIGDLRFWGRRNLPFRTMLHDESTQVRINQPVPAQSRPELFKLCSATPGSINTIEGGDGTVLVLGDSSLPIAWPKEGEPTYSVTLEPQLLIPNRDYVRNEVAVVIEACERFCTHPFRASSGTDYDSWDNVRSCQWR